MGFLSSLFGGLGSALSGAGSSLMGGLSGLAKPLMSMFGGGGGGGMAGLSGLFGGGGGGSMGSPSTSNIMSMFSGGGSAMPVTSSAGSTGFQSMTQPKKKNGLLDSLFPGNSVQGIAGLAAPLLGDMFAPKKASIPNFNNLESVQALKNFRPGNSVSPEYQTMLKNNVGQIRDQKIKDLQQLYHNARPGTDYLTDSAYQRDLAKIDQDIQTNMSNDLARAESVFSGQEQERLSQIAQMDIYSIMAQTGMDAEEATQFKQMFSNVGNMFLTNATRDNSTDDVMKMFMKKQLGVA